jgi:hypothetical protein
MCLKKMKVLCDPNLLIEIYVKPNYWGCYAEIQQLKKRREGQPFQQRAKYLPVNQVYEQGCISKNAGNEITECGRMQM